jgi:hypothetical protein
MPLDPRLDANYGSRGENRKEKAERASSGVRGACEAWEATGGLQEATGSSREATGT